MSCSLIMHAQKSNSILDKKNSKLLEEKLEALNNELGEHCVLSFTKKRLEVNFNENGETYRTDYIYIETLNPEKIYFSDEESAVIVKCKAKEDLQGKLKKFSNGCIERHILKNNIIRAYYRINFNVVGDKDKFINTFKDLIKQAFPEEYE